jgi:hypothetical protein
MADDHEDIIWLQRRRRAQRKRDHRTASDLVQDLGLAALHSRAETGGQNQNVDRTFHYILLSFSICHITFFICHCRNDDLRQ